MTPPVHPVPYGPRLTPYLTVRNGAAALDFYARAFGAVEVSRLVDPAGRIGHAELRIGEARVMLSDEYPEMNVVGPETLGGTSVALHLYTEDVDALAARAIAAGATVLHPVADQFYGDRGGKLRDPFGHTWWIASHIEDVAPDEMARRAAALFAGS
ncbi:MAG: VOC family protein [Gemmatimonadota bacterium]